MTWLVYKRVPAVAKIEALATSHKRRNLNLRRVVLAFSAARGHALAELRDRASAVFRASEYLELRSGSAVLSAVCKFAKIRTAMDAWDYASRGCC